MIFLDNASTTRVFDEAVQAMTEMCRNDYLNPSALYEPALQTEKKLQAARARLAARLGAQPSEVFFTSCATESNTWALCSGFKNKKGSIVLSAGEHASVYENAVRLRSKGYDVRFAPLNRDGTVDSKALLPLLDEQTSLVSILHCSNETGAFNDLSALSAMIRQRCPEALFHSDGVQALGKTDNRCGALGVDLYSISAHKIGGPKGIGALYVRRGVTLAPLLVGGGQEGGARSGTENTPGIVGFAAALDCFEAQYNADELFAMRAALEQACRSAGGVAIQACRQSPCILSVGFEGIKSEILQHLLCERGILVGLGAACSGKVKQNRVLRESGVPQPRIEGSIRISLGVHNTMAQAEEAGAQIVACVEQLRSRIHG